MAATQRRPLWRAAPMNRATLLAVLALLAVAVTASTAPVPFPKPMKPVTADSELRALQGEWVRVRRSLNGGPLADCDGATTAVFRGGRLSFLHKGGASARWLVALGPSKEPRWMDLKDADGSGKTIQGVYRLEGNTL